MGYFIYAPSDVNNPLIDGLEIRNCIFLGTPYSTSGALSDHFHLDECQAQDPDLNGIPIPGITIDYDGDLDFITTNRTLYERSSP